VTFNFGPPDNLLETTPVAALPGGPPCPATAIGELTAPTADVNVALQPLWTSLRRRTITGKPHRGNISTSFSERQNLTLRMNNRRFTRLTNAFSKTVENHRHSLAIHFLHYNFCRIHQTLRVTPAMEAGISDHVWSVEEITSLK
jgi:hypothetical protein